MRRFVVFLPVVLTLALSACGSSSAPSESEAGELIEAHTSLTAPECVKSSSGSDRDFQCTAESGERPVTVEVTVGESGESVVVTQCDDEGSIYKPCDEISHGSG